MTVPEYRTDSDAAKGCLLLFGLGYTGAAIAAAAWQAGMRVVATSRRPESVTPPQGVELIAFAAADAALPEATHVLQTAPPNEDGDPALHRFGPALAAAPALRWAGLLSTTGVYGDRGGARVDEDTPPAPTGPRGRRRLEVETAWRAAFARCAVDLFRVAGIYGPGRSALDELRAGRARRIDKPGHVFSRIHGDDIVRAVLAAMRQDRERRPRVLNLADDEPAPSADVVAEAAALLGIPAPPPMPFATAAASMSDMARSFWAENRRVASRKTQERLGMPWQYPSYREGLRAILEQERRERLAQ